MSDAPQLWASHTEARTTADLLLGRARKTPADPAYRYKKDGQWVSVDWQGFLRDSAAVAGGLVDLGLQVGDRVAISGPTAPLWANQDMGGQIAGLITLGIYPKQTPEQVAYLLEHSESRAVFVADAEELETVLEAAADNPILEAIIPWTDELYQRFRARDARITDPRDFCDDPLPDAVIAQRQQAIDDHDTAILIYTSGTTGPPKGAMITHKNIIAMMELLYRADSMRQGDLITCFLPMAHVTQRIMGFFNMISQGVESAYISNMGVVLQELGEVKPTIFGSVPRLFEKAYNKIQDDVAQKGGAVKKMFDWAVRVGVARIRLLHQGKQPSAWLSLQCGLASKLVFAKIRAAFGGHVRVCYTGAAPIAIDILELFWAADIPIYEAYGMTEATVVTNLNTQSHVRLGTVGRPAPGVAQKLADDGEVLVRGETVFKGYFKNEQATAETIVDGWLHTGDIGEMDEDGFLRITDRKKHLIVTSGGKNVAPANIERAIKNQSPLISHVHAHGDRRPYISAIIAPSPLETLAWGVANGCLSQSVQERLRDQLLADPASRSQELNQAMATVVAHPEFAKTLIEPIRAGNSRLARVTR